MVYISNVYAHVVDNGLKKQNKPYYGFHSSQAERQ